MEAANRGAHEAGGMTIGLNIRLPFEQFPNPYITPELNFEFHYFFMRKYWFAYLAKALVVFPGGFGTLDELFEILTLAQTQKLAKKIIVIVYGKEYWSRVLNLEALADAGAISPDDTQLFSFCDSPEEAFEALKEGLTNTIFSRPRRVQCRKRGRRLPRLCRRKRGFSSLGDRRPLNRTPFISSFLRFFLDPNPTFLGWNGQESCIILRDSE